jgi:hypothetical protein
MSESLVAALKDQYRRQWATLRDLVGHVPEAEWTAGDFPPLVPARLVSHLLSGTETYARSTTYEVFRATQRYTLDWQGCPAGDLPSPAGALQEITAMEHQVVRWLEELGDQGLRDEEKGFPWTGDTKMSRALYLLRHTQNHIGEANSELRRRGLPRGAWG